MAQGFEPMCINQLHRDLMLLFIALTFETFFFFVFVFVFVLSGVTSRQFSIVSCRIHAEMLR